MWYSNQYIILYDVDQTTPSWKEYRQGRATGSILGSILGYLPYPDSGPDHEVEYLSGRKTKVFKPFSLIIMKRGQLMEPGTRDWYAKKHNILVIEVGIAFPKWDTRCGASVDGIVIPPDRLSKSVGEYTSMELIEIADGIIEIKCPIKMYAPLIEYMKTDRSVPSVELIQYNTKVYEEYYVHIKREHFDQMQHGMAILNKSWCDYIVNSPIGIFVQRIPYCSNYYIERVYKPIKIFLDDRLDPTLSSDWRKPLPIT